MKILFHLNSMGRGGAERVVSILSGAFSQKGHEVVVATEWFSEREYPLADGVKRLMVGIEEQEEEKNRILKIVLRHTRLRKCIKAERPDLVISFCVKSNFRAAISMLGMKIPLLVSVRNDPKIDYAPHKLATAIMEQKASGCVFQTKEAMEFFSPKLQKKSAIIYNPLNAEFIKECERLYQEQPKDHEGRIIRRKEIVSVGRITEQKNHELLIKAFAGIAVKYPEYSCRIYGEVENRELYQKLTNLVREYKLEQQVYFMPPSNQIQKEIVNAGLFVLSSDFEGMPNALLEAMTLGIPCVSTDCPCGGPQMLIESYQTGILVPVGDEDALMQAMDTILSNPRQAEEMGAAAREIRTRVEEDRIVAEWFALIDSIIRCK